MSARDAEIARQEVRMGGPKALLQGVFTGCPFCPQGGRYRRECFARAFDCLHLVDRARALDRMPEIKAMEYAEKHIQCVGGIEL